MAKLVKGAMRSPIELLDISSKLRAANRVTQATSVAAQRYHCARVHSLTIAYVRKLAAAVSAFLKVPLEISVSDIDFLSNSGAPLVGDFQGQWLVVELRVFREGLTLFLPQEFALELGQRIRGEALHSLLVPLDAKDITAISFAIAQLLAQDELFQHQRVFLSSARVVKSEDLSIGVGAVITSSRGKCSLNLQIANSNYKIMALFDRPLLARFKAYAEHSLDTTGRATLSRVKCSYNLSLCVNYPSLLKFAEDMQPGRAPISITGRASTVRATGDFGTGCEFALGDLIRSETVMLVSKGIRENG